MNFSLIFLIALAFSGAVNVNAAPVTKSNELFEILNEFLALVPEDKLNELFLEYLYTDAEFQALLEYLKTEEFKKLVQKFNNIEDVINIYDYLEDVGFDVYSLVNSLQDSVELPHLIPRRHSRSARITDGATGFIKDFQAILPLDKIKSLSQQKLKTSPVFAEFFENLRSPRFHKLVVALLVNEEFQEVLQAAKEVGIDIKAIVHFYATLLGFEFPNSPIVKRSIELEESLRKFTNLVPKDQLQKILEEYMTNNEGYKAVSKYMFTDEFKDIVQKSDSIDDVINFYDYLNEAGFDYIYSMVNDLHLVVGLPILKPGRNVRSVKITGGLSGLIADVKAILPIDEIKALHKTELENSPAFAKFIEYLKAPRFQEIVDALNSNEEFQKLRNIAKDGGIDVKAILDLGATLLGLEFPNKRIIKRSIELEESLRKFTNLVPKDQLQKILEEYMTNDEGYKAVSKYMFSDEFKDIVQKSDSIDDVINFYDYLNEAGFDYIYSLVNDLHLVVGLSILKPGRNVRSVKITGGLSGLIADIKAILPIDEIKALHKTELENSPAFAKFIEYLKAPRFQEIVGALNSNEEFQKLRNIAKDGGIDVKAILDLGATLLGLKFPGTRF